MSSALIRSIDFETTGLPPSAAVIEIGWTDVIVHDDGVIEIGQPRSMLVNPFRANPKLVMHPSAQAVHLISVEDLADAPGVDVGFRELTNGVVDVYLAHNSQFEAAFFAPSKPWICTLKAARAVFPEATSHKLQELRFAIPLDVPDREYARAAHRAGPDAYVAAILFRAMLDRGWTVEQMIEVTSAPQVLVTVPFGKHRGKKFSDVPLDYLEWLLTTDVDRDLRHTLRIEIRSRRKGGSPNLIGDLF